MIGENEHGGACLGHIEGLRDIGEARVMSASLFEREKQIVIARTAETERRLGFGRGRQVGHYKQPGDQPQNGGAKPLYWRNWIEHDSGQLCPENPARQGWKQVFPPALARIGVEVRHRLAIIGRAI